MALFAIDPPALLATSRRCAVLTMTVSVIILGYWAWNIVIGGFSHTIPRLIQTGLAATLLFLTSGISLYFLAREYTPDGFPSTSFRSQRLIRQFCATGVFIVALVYLTNYLLSWDFDVDTVLLADRLERNNKLFPHPISAPLAVNFILLSLALLFRDLTTRRKTRPAELMLLMVQFAALLSIFSNLYSLYSTDGLSGSSSFSLMTIPESMLFITLSIGGLTVRPATGITAVFTNKSAVAGQFWRTFPAIVFSLLFLGWLSLQLQKNGLIDNVQGVSLLCGGILLIITGLYWRSANMLYSMDMDRQKAETVRNRFFDVSMDPMVINNLQGRVIQANPALSKALGYSLEETESHPLMYYIHPNDRETTTSGFKNLITGKATSINFENRCRCSDGSWKWFAWAASIFLEDNLLYVVGKDITEFKRTTAHLSATLNTAADAIISTDSKGIIESFNPAAEVLFGYSSEEILGSNINQIVLAHNNDSDGYPNILSATQLIRSSTDRKAQGRHKNRTTLPLEFNIGESEMDSAKHFTWILRDVSERYRHINELEKAREVAEEASKTKSNFLATMSHEIRTPMNGVIGMIDVLNQSGLKAFQLEMVELIRNSAELLLAIIDDILDFSKIEAGKLEVQLHPFNVATTVEKACSMMDHLARRSKVELTVFCDPRIPSMVLGDTQRLQQVVVNLVNNAIKFSSKLARQGRVSVRLSLVRLDMTRADIRLDVIDNGIGMDQVTQEKLFNPFTQADGSISRRFGGTGLGLTIVQQLTRLMGGNITVYSVPDEGAEFTVHLSMPLAPQQTAQENPEPDISGLLCLVIGRSVLASDLSVYLSHAGARANREADLQNAINWLSDDTLGRRVLIIETGNTSLTAKELGKTLNLQPEPDGVLPIVVIERGCGHSQQARHTKGLLAIDGNALSRLSFLKAIAIAAGREALPAPKPVASPQTRTKVEPTPAAQPVDEPSAEKCLILVAEDNPTNQEVLQQQLKLLEVSADFADNGREALKRWRNGHYQLLLTDLHMPEMDGYELTTAIRNEEKQTGTRIAIVALTANALSGVAEHCFSLGMDAYLTKPVRLHELRGVLDKWATPNNTAAADRVVAEPEESSTIAAETAAKELKHGDATSDKPANGTAVVNIQILKDLVGSDEEVLRRMLKIFRETAASIAQNIDTAWQAGDISAVAAAAHKLKSSARSIGALGLGDICMNMESAAKEGRNEEVSGYLPHFTAELTQVSEYLANW